MGDMNKIQHLANAARAGDKNSERILFEKLIVRFEYLSKRKIRGDDARDVAMEACKTVVEKYASVKEAGERFEVWALAILRNKIGNYLQKQETVSKNLGHRVHADRLAANTDPEGYIQLTVALKRCLQKIVARFPRYARALNLAHMGYGTNDICRRMNIVPAHYYVMLNRCRHMLRRCLEKDEMP